MRHFFGGLLSSERMSSQIRILFTNNGSVEDDSSVSFQKAEEGILAKYKDYSIQTSIILAREDAHLYLLNILKLLHFDRDPYRNVQIWFPAVPPIFLRPTDFKAYPELLDSVMNLFGFTITSWFRRQNNSDTPVNTLQE